MGDKQILAQIEDLRKEMEKEGNKYGLGDHRVILISKKIDFLHTMLVKKQLKAKKEYLQRINKNNLFENREIYQCV